jgi:predicted Zn-dependent protease
MALPASDQHHLNAAEGWLDLDEALEAGKELDCIAIENLSHPSVLLLRCRMYLAVHKAEYAYDIATTLTAELAEIPEAWFYLACASARLGQNETTASALKNCLLAASRQKREAEWQQRALAASDLESYWCSEQMEI